MNDKFEQEDPFKKYGGKQIEDKEDPFKKYGGSSIDQPVKKKNHYSRLRKSLQLSLQRNQNPLQSVRKLVAHLGVLLAG